MEKNPNKTTYEVICVIVNFGLGSKVLKIAKHGGISSGVILLGMGTVRNRILQFLELTDIRKEIVLMASDSSTAAAAIKSIDDEFELKKPNHGIAFTMPLQAIIDAEKQEHSQSKGGGHVMYNSIFVVVDRGKAEFVMDAATGAGARGGTIIKARGSGINEKLFMMDIEPEKELVMILSEVAKTDKIVAAIREQLEIDKAGNGIIFCQSVNKAYGLV